MIKEHEIQFAGERLLLNNRRSIYWPDKQMLIFSDIHLGKAAHFRQNGIAIPGNVIKKDLKALKELILHYNATVVTVVGDFFHAGINSDTQFFSEWAHSLPQLHWNIVKGNHDKSVNAENTDGIFYMNDSLFIEPITLVHHPEPEQSHTISGHIHPGVILRASCGKALKIACFLVSENRIILPAFSQFTGLDTGFLKKSIEKYTPYVVLDEGVIRV
ncbi:MAG: ligase-associated DNA damage response endonuclease PdeM [Bacteroidetes bacterium]|nr:MAG: ligase-associated DNA damage response endonuclease PdeM [Bacteroidota bacterium]